MEKSKLHKLHSLIDKNFSAGLIIAIISFLVIVLFSLTPFYEKIELAFYDLRFKIKPAIKQWDKLSIIEMDDDSISAIGKFPWPRKYYADGIKLLSQKNILLTTFDIEFPDKSNSTVEKINNKSVIINNDLILSNAIKASKKIILPYSFQKIALKSIEHLKSKKEYDIAYKLFLKKASVPLPPENKDDFKKCIDHDRTNIGFPIYEFTKYARGFGFVDSDFDIDGASRRIRLIRVFEDRIFFHLGLVMLANSANVKLTDIEIQPGNYILLKNVENRVSFKIEDIKIPIDKKGRMLINWAGSYIKSFDHITYYALFDYNSDSYNEYTGETGKFYEKIYYIIAQIIEEKGLPGDYNNALDKIYDLEESLLSVKNAEKKFSILKELEKNQKIIDSFIQNIINNYQLKMDELVKKNKDNNDKKILDRIKEIENIITAFSLVKKVDSLRNHIAIIGLTATATQDLGITPLSSEYWMVGTYPNVINTILQKDFIHKMPGYLSYLILFLLTIFIALLIQRLNAKKSIITIISSTITVNIVIISLFSFINLWLDQIGINMAVLFPSLTLAALKFHKEESQKRFIKNAFSHYLSPSVIDNLILHPDALQLGGVEKELSIFFSDIQGFSTISEKLTPVQLVKLLNEYLSEMSDIILKYEGTVDKYEGDAIMAFYGAPIMLRDHALRSCLAAIDMQERLIILREKWVKQGKNALLVRMGINTGNAVVGNMGSRSRMDYTVMGDSVNLASRLEGANKYYGTFTMINQSTYKIVKNKIETRELDTIQVVGKKEPTTVYEVLCKKNKLSSNMQELLEYYLKGLKLFKGKNWLQARAAFKNALKVNKDDGPSNAYIKRCSDFIRKPPPRNWSGVYTLKNK